MSEIKQFTGHTGRRIQPIMHPEDSVKALKVKAVPLFWQHYREGLTPE